MSLASINARPQLNGLSNIMQKATASADGPIADHGSPSCWRAHPLHSRLLVYLSRPGFDHTRSIAVSPGRPKLERPKRLVTLRLDADLLDRLHKTGPGWQSRLNDAVRAWMDAPTH
jgi:uncharacterized protein (DUF4415 family)